MGSTNASLLGRLGNLEDSNAWAEFQARYGPRLMAWSLKHGLQQADAEDLAQDVMRRLVRRMPTFQYQPGRNFSGYLKTIWDNVLNDFFTERARKAQGSGDSGVLEQLHKLPGGDLTRELEDLFSKEELEEAMERAKPLCSPRDWAIFMSSAFEGRSGTDIAREYGLTLANVGMIIGRVRKKIAAQLDLLRGTPKPSDDTRES
jgi:RNA polymerase sigma-70 factor (ECF subfamily)